KDRISIQSDTSDDYNNDMISLKYGHNFSEKSRAELILVSSKYKYGINYEADANENFDFGYELNEYQAKLNFNYKLSNKHKLSYGLSSKLYSIDPGNIVPIGRSEEHTSELQSREKLVCRLLLEKKND